MVNIINIRDWLVTILNDVVCSVPTQNVSDSTNDLHSTPAKHEPEQWIHGPTTLLVRVDVYGLVILIQKSSVEV